MAQYSIKDLEKVTGIKAHTIRIWEKRYGIVVPSRSDTNIRSYSDDDLKKLLNISLLNRQGIKISKLAKLSEEDLQNQVKDLSENPEDSDSKIEGLLMAMVDIDEERFNKSLELTIRAYGFEDAFTNVVVPFMQKAGILWMAGTISPAQEHFVSNLVRQKLIAEIDRMDYVVRSGAKRFLLFLPEGELHELGLLYVSYLIRRKGHETLYFGQSTPLNSVVDAAEKWEPDYIVFSIINSLAFKKMEDFLKEVRSIFSDKVLYVSGYQTQFISKKDLGEIMVIDDYQHFEKTLENIV